MIDDTPSTLAQRAGILVLLWFTGLYLRVPILVAPPLAPGIAGDLSLSQTGIGALTTLPVLMLAAGAIPGAYAIARLGARRTLVIAVLLVAAGSAARGLAPPAAILFAATIVLGLGIAAMQPALPAILPLWCPGFVGLGSAVYMNGMLMGEFIGAGLTLPVIMPLAGESWRLTLLAWSLPAVLIAIALTRPASVRASASRGTRWNPDWRDGQVWRLGLLLGSASTVFFGTNAYMGSILERRDALDRLPETLFLFNLSQVIASLAMLGLTRHMLARRGPIIASGLLCVAGLATFVWLDGWAALVGAFAVGFASAVQLILLVSLPPQITDAATAGRLSAGMFTLGYAAAFAVPLIGGLTADFTGDALTALLPVGAYALLATGLAPGLRLRVRPATATA